MLSKLISKLDYKNSVGLILRTADKSLELALDSQMKDRCGLTASQWKVIIVLSIREGITQRELANFIAVEGPTLVPIIDKMEDTGYLVRKADPNDRRSNKIFLTTKSANLVEEIINTILDFRVVITKGISKSDIERTKAVLNKMMQNTEDFMQSKGQKVLPTLLKDK